MNEFHSYTLVGIVSKPFGIKGELKVVPKSFDFERHRLLKKVLLLNSKTNEHCTLEVTDTRFSRGIWFLRFKDYNAPEPLKKFRGWHLLIPDAERLPTPKGSYYVSDLVDLDVIDPTTQECCGKVVDVLEFPANQNFVLSINGKEIMAPWIDDCIGEIDLTNRRIFVKMDYLKELLGF